MTLLHKDLSQEDWSQMSLPEQMMNIGSEISRALNWKQKNNQERSKNATYRALELIDLTLVSTSGVCRLREITRLRETIVDYFFYDNIYSSTEKQLRSYFDCFLYLARPKA